MTDFSLLLDEGAGLLATELVSALLENPAASVSRGFADEAKTRVPFGARVVDALALALGVTKVRARERHDRLGHAITRRSSRSSSGADGARRQRGAAGRLTSPGSAEQTADSASPSAPASAARSATQHPALDRADWAAVPRP